MDLMKNEKFNKEMILYNNYKIRERECDLNIALRDLTANYVVHSSERAINNIQSKINYSHLVTFDPSGQIYVFYKNNNKPIKNLYKIKKTNR